MTTQFTVPAPQFEAFAKGYIEHLGLESKIEGVSIRTQEEFIGLGYEKSEIKTTLMVRLEKSMYLEAWLLFETPHTKETRSIYGSSISTIKSSYPKTLNILGAEVQEYLNIEEQLRKVKAEEESAKIKAENAAKAAAKAEGEAKFQAWIQANGSDLLKSRIELGFEYECLAKTEYAKWVLGDNVIKFSEFPDNHKVIRRPNLEVMSKVRELKANYRIDKIHGVMKHNGAIYIDLSVILPDGETANYVLPTDIEA